MNKKINEGGPAFPRPFSDFAKNGTASQSGMTLRQYYAAQALHGLVACYPAGDKIGERAFAYADSMIAFEEKEKASV